MSFNTSLYKFLVFSYVIMSNALVKSTHFIFFISSSCFFILSDVFLARKNITSLSISLFIL